MSGTLSPLPYAPSQYVDRKLNSYDYNVYKNRTRHHPLNYSNFQVYVHFPTTSLFGVSESHTVFSEVRAETEDTVKNGGYNKEKICFCELGLEAKKQLSIKHVI